MDNQQRTFNYSPKYFKGNKNIKEEAPSDQIEPKIKCGIVIMKEEINSSFERLETEIAQTKNV